MIVTLQQLKDALGIADATQDVVLTSSLSQAQALLDAYIGFDVSDTARVHEYVYTPEQVPFWSYGSSRRNFVHLPYWPVLELVDVRNGADALISPMDYKLVPGPGRVDFFNGLPSTDYLTFRFRAGFDPVPADLTAPALNIASAIFNNGGTISTASSNALKSLTMFDAMSMSFDTGGEAVAGGAMGLLEPWAFVLNKYRVVNKPVLK